MPIGEEHVGRSYPKSEPYEVSRAKIAELAQALGDDNPAYSGSAPVAPPTFVALVMARAWDAMFDDPELGLALKRIVHADQAFTFERSLVPGDVVTAALTIEKVRVRGPVDWVGVRVDIKTVGGDPVCTATSTFVHTREEAA